MFPATVSVNSMGCRSGHCVLNGLGAPTPTTFIPATMMKFTASSAGGSALGVGLGIALGVDTDRPHPQANNANVTIFALLVLGVASPRQREVISLGTRVRRVHA